MALCQTCIVLGSALGPLPLGVVKDVTGTFDAGFLAFFFLEAALAVACLAFGAPPQRRSQQVRHPGRAVQGSCITTDDVCVACVSGRRCMRMRHLGSATANTMRKVALPMCRPTPAAYQHHWRVPRRPWRHPARMLVLACSPHPDSSNSKTPSSPGKAGRAMRRCRLCPISGLCRRRW